MLIYVLVLVLVALAFLSLRVANQYQRCVIFNLGKFDRIAGPGLFILKPFIEWQVKLDLRTITAAVEQQEAITRDNVPIKVNAVIWYRIIDAEKAVMEVRDVANSVIQVAVTTLRNVLGQHTLDDVLKEQTALAEQISRASTSQPSPGASRSSGCR